MVVYCGVEPAKRLKAVRAVIGELKDFHQEASPQDLAKAKKYAKGRLLLRLEDARSVVAAVEDI